MTIEQFKSELSRVDWFYEFQDCFTNSKYKSGKEQFVKVKLLAENNSEFEELFSAANPFYQIKKEENKYEF